MARTVRDANLETRTARSRLTARGKPYYRTLDAGLHLGYRRNRNGGVWVMRSYVGGQSYKVERIGPADDKADADGSAFLSFHHAQAKARKHFVARKREAAGLPAHSGPYTVKDCVTAYLLWMDGARKSAKDARARAEALIVPKLGDTECARLTADEIQRWLNDLAKQPPRLRTKKGEKQQYRDMDGDPEAKRRRRATANRTLTILKAALNRAWRAGKISSDDAWRRVEPFEQADAARARYLSVEEAKRLINSSGKEFRMLVQAALATGARYGELAALNVGDFNADSSTLHIRASKSGKGRHVVLADEGAKFFSGLTAGRAGDQPMIAKADGRRWAPAHQARPMTEACKVAKVKDASFHCLRHTYASLSIMNGAPLLVVAKNLGHADTRMVERHYGHLAPSFIADAIRAAAPRFGFKASRKVTAIRDASRSV